MTVFSDLISVNPIYQPFIEHYCANAIATGQKHADWVLICLLFYMTAKTASIFVKFPDYSGRWYTAGESAGAAYTLVASAKSLSRARTMSAILLFFLIFGHVFLENSMPNHALSVVTILDLSESPRCWVRWIWDAQSITIARIKTR